MIFFLIMFEKLEAEVKSITMDLQAFPWRILFFIKQDLGEIKICNVQVYLASAFFVVTDESCIGIHYQRTLSWLRCTLKTHTISKVQIEELQCGFNCHCTIEMALQSILFTSLF